MIKNIKDEKEVEKILDEANSLFNEFESLDCFKVACIEGSCLGGGLEFALLFDRLLLEDSKNTRVGLPEVNLGLIPGFFGCLRLTNRIGLKSLDLILTGRVIDSRKAKKLGLADEKVPSLVLKDRALALKEKDFKKKKKSFLLEKLFKSVIFFLAKRQVKKKTKSFYPAPLLALKLVRKCAFKKVGFFF